MLCIQLVLTLDDDINDKDDLDSGDDDAGVYVKSMPGWPAESGWQSWLGSLSSNWNSPFTWAKVLGSSSSLMQSCRSNNLSVARFSPGCQLQMKNMSVLSATKWASASVSEPSWLGRRKGNSFQDEFSWEEEKHLFKLVAEVVCVVYWLGYLVILLFLPSNQTSHTKTISARKIFRDTPDYRSLSLYKIIPELAIRPTSSRTV